MHPAATAWHIKRRLREQGRISVKVWEMWATAYINALPEGPWQEFCIRETHRVTGAHVTLWAKRRKRADLEEFVEALASTGKED